MVTGDNMDEKENKRIPRKSQNEMKTKKKLVKDSDIKKDESLKNGIIDIIKEYKKFYKENLKIKHIVMTIIMIIIFFILVKLQWNSISDMSTSSEDTSNITKNTIIQAIVKNEAPVNFLLILAGISPYLYVSVLGVFTTYTLLIEITSTYLLNKSIFTLIISSIGAIIKIIAYSLSIATGMYYCSLSTKRFKYSQISFFGYTDFKKAIYQIRGNEEKVHEMDIQKEKNIEKKLSYNVKVPYKLFVVSFIISLVLSAIGTIFLH